MARADLLLDLVQAGAAGDQSRFRGALEALVVEERAKQHHVLADRLAAHLSTSAKSNGPANHRSPSPKELIYQVSPTRTLDELFLSDVVRAVGGTCALCGLKVELDILDEEED